MQRSSLTRVSISCRSDTRAPDVIFVEGFQPSDNTKKKDWWKPAINPSSHGEPDACSSKCVCASGSLFGAAVFPTALKEAGVTYLYFIASPGAVKVTLDKELEGSQWLPADMTCVPVDLHSHQVDRARESLAKIPGFSQVAFTQGIGGTLYAFETIFARIPTENIICAIKITRGPQCLETIDAANKVTFPYRQFQIQPGVVLNNKFSIKQSLRFISKAGTGCQVELDYSTEKQLTLEFLKKLPRNKTLETFKPRHGIAGKVFKPLEKMTAPLWPKMNSLSLFSFLKPTKQEEDSEFQPSDQNLLT